jgi:MFS family permease
MSARSATLPGTAPRGTPRGFRLRRYLTGLGLDLVGDQIWFVALAWAATHAGDAGMAGLVVAAGTIPRVLFLIPAGVLADRLGALRQAQLAQLVRLGIMGLVVVVTIASSASIEVLLPAAVIFGVADSFRMPAAGAMLPSLVSRDGLARAQGISSTISRIASVAAGPLAGAALSVGGLRAVAAINVVLFATSYAAYRSLSGGARSLVPVVEDGGGGLVDGLRYLRGQRTVCYLLLVATMLNLGLAGPINLGIVLRAESEGWGPGTLGLIVGAFGLGATLGALSLTFLRPREQAVLAGYAWSAAAGVALFGLGRAPSFAATIAVAGVVGFALGPAGALLLGSVQASTDARYIGRVMGLVSFSSFGVAPLGLAGFGFLAARVGTRQAFDAASALVCFVAVVGVITPALRRTNPPSASSPQEGDDRARR